MSEDATTKSGSGEPSMEEILASIRQIINQNDQPSAGAPATAEPAIEPLADTAPEDTDVLELTNILEETPAVAVPPPALEMVDAPVAEPPVPPTPSVDEIMAAMQAPVAAAPVVVAPPSAPAPSPPEQLVTGDGLVSPAAASAAAGALGALATTLVREKMEHSLPLGNGMRTLESMVIEAMKPLLKEWLDANLAGIVERIVQAEVEKLTKRLGG